MRATAFLAATLLLAATVRSQRSFSSCCPELPRKAPALAAPSPANESHPMLFILVEYDDPTFRTRTKWQSTFAKVADYYSRVSGGKLPLTRAKETFGTPDDGIVGPYRLGLAHPSIAGGQQWAFGRSWQNSRDFARAAILAANEHVNFKSFDKDNSHAVSSRELHIVIVISG